MGLGEGSLSGPLARKCPTEADAYARRRGGTRDPGERLRPASPPPAASSALARRLISPPWLAVARASSCLQTPTLPSPPPCTPHTSMQAASNFLQDKVLGGPVEIDENASPEYKHRPNSPTYRALAWQVPPAPLHSAPPAAPKADASSPAALRRPGDQPGPGRRRARARHHPRQRCDPPGHRCVDHSSLPPSPGVCVRPRG